MQKVKVGFSGGVSLYTLTVSKRYLMQIIVEENPSESSLQKNVWNFFCN